MKQRLNHETGERTEEESSMVGNHRTEETLAFDSPEAMIRYDAARTTVPPQMRDRVMRSISQESGESNPRPWWKRWMPF